MNCSIYKENIMKYFDGTLNDIETAQLKQHMKTCGSCREEFDTLENIFSVLEEDKDIQPPQNFEELVMNKISNLEQEEIKERSTASKVFLVTSLVLIIVLSIAFSVAVVNFGLKGITKQLSGTISPIVGTWNFIQKLLGSLYSVTSDTIRWLVQASYLALQTYFYVFVFIVVMMFAAHWMLISIIMQNRKGVVR